MHATPFSVFYVAPLQAMQWRMEAKLKQPLERVRKRVGVTISGGGGEEERREGGGGGAKSTRLILLSLVRKCNVEEVESKFAYVKGSYSFIDLSNPGKRRMKIR